MATSPNSLRSKPELAETYARLRRVKVSAGFLPTSRTELTEAIALLQPEETPEHLDKILAHQINHKVEAPIKAIATKVKSYADFAHKAYTDEFKLLELGKDLQLRLGSSSADPSKTMAAAGLTGIDGVPQLVRYYDLSQLVGPEPPTDFPFFPLYPTHRENSAAIDAYTAPTPAFVVANHIQQFTENVSLGDAQDVLRDADLDQQYRLDFWNQRLEEARTNNVGHTVLVSLIENGEVIVHQA